jgi:signal transduction histidine kinase
LSSLGGSTEGSSLAAASTGGQRYVLAAIAERLRSLGSAFAGDPGGRWGERLPLATIAVLGALAAAVDGGLAAANPHAQPPHLAEALRVAIIGVLVLAGIFARTDRLHARMGVSLLAAVPLVSLWLLNGSELAVPFTVGAIFAGAMPALFSYLLLAHPTGRLRSKTERALVGVCGGTMVLSWAIIFLGHHQPTLATPLLRCAPDCPRKAVELAGLHGAGGVASAVGLTAWFVLTAGTLVLLSRRLAQANAPVRRVIGPAVTVAAASLPLLAGFYIAHAAGSGADTALGTAYVAVALATPLAIMLGLLLERLFMGRALTDLLDRLTVSGSSDVETVMAETLHDPTLTVAYATGAPGRFADAAGAPVELPPPGDGRAAVLIGDGEAPAAAVLFDAQLAEQERYVQAGGEAAMMWLAKDRLESDQASSRAELAVSRRRVQEAAEKERQRIQRDLHDGAQQRLLAMRAKVGRLLSDDGHDTTQRGALVDIQRELGETLQEVRTLAEGVYPPLLVEYGLGSALRSVSRGLGTAVTVSDEGVGRLPAPIEGAVYFTCLEALQNALKHAGEGATARVQLWREQESLLFQVADDGTGFVRVDAARGEGLVNMRDRITALGGTLSIHSLPSSGTLVFGRVPAPAAETEAQPPEVCLRSADG